MKTLLRITLIQFLVLPVWACEDEHANLNQEERIPQTVEANKIDENYENKAATAHYQSLQDNRDYEKTHRKMDRVR